MIRAILAMRHETVLDEIILSPKNTSSKKPNPLSHAFDFSSNSFFLLLSPFRGFGVFSCGFFKIFPQISQSATNGIALRTPFQKI